MEKIMCVYVCGLCACENVCVYNVKYVPYTEESNLDKKYCFFCAYIINSISFNTLEFTFPNATYRKLKYIGPMILYNTNLYLYKFSFITTQNKNI